MLFCSPREVDARLWWSKATRQSCPVYKVELAPESTVVLLDLVWYNYAVRIANDELGQKRLVLGGATDGEEVALAARRYWSGDWWPAQRGGPRVEALVRGRATIVESVRF